MMKNMVFLWLFVGLVLANTVSVSADLHYDVDDRDGLNINIGDQSINREGHFDILGTLVLDDGVVFYGSKLVSTDDTRVYHGYMIKLDAAGEVLFEFTSDDDEQQEITHVIEYLSSLVIVMHQESEMHQDSVKTTKFLWWENGELTHQETIDVVDFRTYAVIDDVLYLARRRSGHYDLTIDKYKEIDTTALRGLAHQQSYEGHVMFTALDPFQIGNQHYDAGSHLIDYPGHYTFATTGQSLSFSVLPVLADLEHGGVYHEDITLDLSAGQLFVNGEAFPASGMLKAPGHYRIDIYGKHNFKRTYEVTRTHTLNGVEDGGIYHESRTVSFTGEAMLNGTPIANGTLIEQNGLHTLVITGVNGYEAVIEFELNQSNNTGFSKHLELGIGIVVSAVFIAGVSMLAIFKKWK